MNDLFALIAFVTGVPMMFIGYIWLLVASKKFGIMWMLADLLIFPVAGLILIHGRKAWTEIRLPLIILLIGIALIVITLEFVPQS